MIAAIAVLAFALTLGCELTIYRYSLWGRQKQVYRAIAAAGAVICFLATLVSVVRLLVR